MFYIMHQFALLYQHLSLFRSLKRKQRKENQNIKVIPKNGFLHSQESRKKVLDSLHLNNDENREIKDSSSSSSNEWVEEMNRRNKKKSFDNFQDAEKQQKEEVEASQGSPEFSPILYWREPIPEVEIVDLDPQPSTSKNKNKTESKGQPKYKSKPSFLGKVLIYDNFSLVFYY